MFTISSSQCSNTDVVITIDNAADFPWASIEDNSSSEAPWKFKITESKLTDEGFETFNFDVTLIATLRGVNELRTTYSFAVLPKCLYDADLVLEPP